MTDPLYGDRFGGMARLYGVDGLERLSQAHVAVVGVGGVGSWVVEALARSGVGRLTLIDMDDVCVTNTNRQLPALADTIGLPKVSTLAARVKAISPGCEVHQSIEFLTASTAERLLDGSHDFVVDAVDSMAVKALILARCRDQQVPVITSGAAGGRRDGTRIQIADLGRAGGDTLLQQVRRKLRRDHGFPSGENGRAVDLGVPAVFSPEKPHFPHSDGSCGLEPEQAGEKGLRLDCSAGFGAATFVTGAFGFALAGEVVRRIALGSGKDPELA